MPPIGINDIDGAGSITLFEPVINTLNQQLVQVIKIDVDLDSLSDQQEIMTYAKLERLMVRATYDIVETQRPTVTGLEDGLYSLEFPLGVPASAIEQLNNISLVFLREKLARKARNIRESRDNPSNGRAIYAEVESH